MKYIFFRLSKGWLLWGILFLVFFLTLLFSMNVYNNTSTLDSYWEHFVYEYNSKEDIDEQILQLTKLQDEILSNSKEGLLEINDQEIIDVFNNASESKEILCFLKSHNLNYKNVADGNVYFSDSRDVRNYGDQCLIFCFVFQLVVAVILLSQIVNQGRTNGAFVFSQIMRGRKQCFFRELKVFFLSMSVLYWIQISFIYVLSVQIPSPFRYLLFVDSSGVTLLSVEQEFLINIISLYFILLFYWSILFCVSQLVYSNINYFILSISCIVSIFILLPKMSNIKFLYSWQIMASSIYSNDITLPFYVLSSIIRMIICGILIAVTWLYTKKKKMQIRYE